MTCLSQYNISGPIKLKPATFSAFAAVIALYAVTMVWLVRPPHALIVERYGPYVLLIACGVIFGSLLRPVTLRHLIVLGLGLMVMNGIVHLIAVQAGLPVDAKSPAGSLMVVVLSAPVCIVLSLLGGGIASLVRWLAIGGH